MADIGETITIGSENFYVISNDGTTVSMLAYYNLNAGGVYDGSTWIEYNNPTYKQDESMKGYVSSGYPYEGTLAFADSYEWENNKIESVSMDYYSTYLKEALTKYDTYIKGLGANITSARLIRRKELSTLGCDASNNSCLVSGKEWLYSSSYWTDSAFGCDTESVWRVESSGEFYDTEYFFKISYGVRPVLDILVSEINI